MTLYGYARVSVREPEDKNLDLQVERLVRAGCAMCNTRAVRALAWLGPEEVEENLATIEKRLSSRDFEELAASRAVMPAWLAEPVSAMMSDA